ncbi:peptidyl-prolyl cis-trans isomerase FKBP7 [Latimeria chalumnae]|uniref:peptidylprolyl isomerase n=1 Tax=Latimeria chalumnae TaxID=7897 RepID=H3A6F7_LATCH|nr:PREDICTED: peptidyl-prolyl cis-trans isomerase FKBP7 [Latimeria chalumnae]|eukprot:XP_006012632.1 PREDICTED: peptidyl-prolyl cis-trans isomerase FKBP7 [Latimeria chalumnae]
MFLVVYLQVFNLFVGSLNAESVKKVDEEVKIEVLHLPEHCEPKSKKGDLLNAHYDGFLAKDGAQFYCSRTENVGHPKWFVLGVGQVIKGLDIGMMNMCPGEKRRVTIPPSLGFGQLKKEKIPSNSTIIFEIELYAVTKGPRSIDAFKKMDLDNDKKLCHDEVRQYLKEEFEKDSNKQDQSYQDLVLTDIFQKNDHDGDGFISVKEYSVYQHDEL